MARAVNRRTASLMIASTLAAPALIRPREARAITQTVGGVLGKVVDIGLVAVNMALLPTSTRDVAHVLAFDGHNAPVYGGPSPDDTPGMLLKIKRNGGISVMPRSYQK